MKKKRGRPAGLSKEKKAAILAVARALFKAHGFKKVSIDEICREADVSRMTFYKHFQDKIELVIAILDEENQKNLQAVNQVMKHTSSFLQKFEMFKKLNLDFQERLGEVFMKDILGEDQDPRIVRSFGEAQKMMATQTEQFLRLGQKEGNISPDHPMPFLLAMIQMLNEVFFRPEFIKLIPDPMKRSDVLNHFYFYGVKGKRS